MGRHEGSFSPMGADLKYLDTRPFDSKCKINFLTKTGRWSPSFDELGDQFLASFDFKFGKCHVAFAAILTRASSLHAATTACSRSFAAGLSATQCRRRLRHPAARRHPPRRPRRGPAPVAPPSPAAA